MRLQGKEGVSVGGFVEDYFELKGRSRFCLVPGGTSPWTNHLYESFFAGCIPVILSDEYEVAFQVGVGERQTQTHIRPRRMIKSSPS